MKIAELDYDLPPQRIATTPAEPRDSAKLMVIFRKANRIEHHRVCDLPRLEHVLRAGDVMIINQSRVVPARFDALRSATGGRVEGLFLQEPIAQHWLVMLESRGTLTPGEYLDLLTHTQAQSNPPAMPPQAFARLQLLERQGDGRWLTQLHSQQTTHQVLHHIGSTPLPPYIRKQRQLRQESLERQEDFVRYNTVYAQVDGSVAAPTAGLHFTPDLLAQLAARGIARHALTLHVGLGTFAPVRESTLESHRMHREWIHVPASVISTLGDIHQAREISSTPGPHHALRILAVGTTTVRALESLPVPLPTDSQGFATDTELFITPGFHFRHTDMLLTNFHLPKSTLLAMVAALPDVGVARLLEWYRIAIAHEYRFYSFGDAMLLV